MFMRKVLLFAFTAMVVSSVANAQINKGTVLLGGNIYLGNNKFEGSTPTSYEKTKATNIGIFPSVGVAIKPNTILGISLRYSQWKYTSVQYSGDHKNKNYGTEVFLRRYLTLGKGFYLFAQPGVYFYRAIQDTRYYSSSEEINKSWNTGINLYPGISYAVNKRFHLEAGLGNIANLSYSENKKKSKQLSNGQTSTSKGSEFSVSSSLSSNSPINIGFRFFLSKKGKE
jgi:hypothetical protein